MLTPSDRVTPQLRSPSRAVNWYEPPDTSWPPSKKTRLALNTDWRLLSAFRTTFTTTE